MGWTAVVTDVQELTYRRHVGNRPRRPAMGTDEIDQSQ